MAEDNFLYEFLNFDQVKKIIESHLNGKQNKDCLFGQFCIVGSGLILSREIGEMTC